MSDRLYLHITPERHSVSDGEEEIVFHWRVEIEGDTNHRHHTIGLAEARRWVHQKATARMKKGRKTEIVYHDRRGVITDRSTFLDDPPERPG